MKNFVIDNDINQFSIKVQREKQIKTLVFENKLFSIKTRRRSISLNWKVYFIRLNRSKKAEKTFSIFMY